MKRVERTCENMLEYSMGFPEAVSWAARLDSGTGCAESVKRGARYTGVRMCMDVCCFDVRLVASHALLMPVHLADNVSAELF